MTSLLTIKDAAEFLKVSTKTLRRWEKKNILIPLRTSGGHRRYSLTQLTDFKKAKRKRHQISYVLPIKPTRIEISSKIDLKDNKVQLPKFSKIKATKPIFPIQKVSFHFLSLNIFKKVTYASLIVLLFFSLTTILSQEGFKIPKPSILKELNQKVKNNLDSTFEKNANDQKMANLRETQEKIRPSVLAATSFDNVGFKVNVESIFEKDIAVNGGSITTSAIVGNIFNTGTTTLNIGSEATALNLGAATGTTTINNSVNIGAGTAGSVDLTGGDLLITDDLEVNGTSYIPTLVIGGDTFTDLTGTGLSVSDGILSTTLGTSIESSEITDDTIKEADLNTTNSATDNYILSYDNSSGGFTWIAESTGESSPWTDSGTLVYLDTTTDNLTVGGSTNLAKLAVNGDTDEIQLLVQGHSTQTSNLAVFEQFDGTDVFSLTNAGNLTLAGDMAVNGGDITSSATTFNLVNATPTTINFASAATTLNIAAGGALVRAINIGTGTGVDTISIGTGATGADVIAIGGGAGTLAIDTDDWDIGTTGNMTGIGNITADGAISFTPGSTSNITFNTDSDSTVVVTGLSAGSGSGLCIDASNNVITCAAGSGGSPWTYSSPYLYPDNATDFVGIGTITTSEMHGLFTVSGARTGKALAILNETGDQDILTASVSGDTKFVIDNNGYVGIGTTNPGAELEIEGSGVVLLLPQEDSPANPTIAFGDGDTGIFEERDDRLGFSFAGSDDYFMGGTGIWADRSSTFYLTNETASATNPVYAFLGDVDTGIGLAAANALSLIAGGTNVMNITTSNVGIGTTAPTSLLHTKGAVTGKALAIFDEEGDQNILTASASGTTVANLDRSGNLAIEGQLSDLSGGVLAINDNLQVIGNSILDSGSNTRIGLGDTTTLTNTTLSLSGTTTITASSATTFTCSDCVNFDDISNSLTLDEATTITNALSNDFTINLSSSGDFVIQDAGSPVFTFTDTGALTQADTGQITFTGNVDAQNGLDVTTANLTVGGANFTVAPASGNITTAGTVSLPNSNTLTGAASYVQLNAGLAVGGGTTYYFDSSGDINANAGTFGGTFAANSTASFTPDSTNDVTITTDADSTLKIAGLSSSTGSGLCIDASNNVITCAAGSGGSPWTYSSPYLYPDNATDFVGMGTTTTGEIHGLLTVSGTRAGRALVVLNDTGSDQNILTASASGTTVLSLNRSGNLSLLSPTANADRITFVPYAAGSNTYTGTATSTDLTDDRTWTFPDSTGDVCLSSGNCDGGAGGSKWTNSGTTTYLTETTDDLVVGNTTPLSGAKISFDGDEDEIQMILQAHSTQNNNLLVLEDSSDNDLSWFDESGNLRIGTSAPDTGKLNVTGAFIGKALAILDETGDQAILTASASGTPVMTLGRTGNLSLVNSGSSNIDFNLSSDGDFTISDDGTPFFTFTDGGALTQAGSGQVTFTGNVDAQNGLDVTTASLTVGGANASITIAGVITGATLNIDNLRIDGNTLSSTTGDVDVAPVAASNLDIDVTGGGEIQIDGGLTDIGSGTYTYANGDDDLGVAGDLEVINNLYVGGNQVVSNSLWTNTDNVYHPYGEYGSVVDLAIGGTATGSAVFQVYGSGTNAGDIILTGGDIEGANDDWIDIAEIADDTFTFGRNDAGTVTITAADNDATAALSILSGGAAVLTLDTGGGAALNVGNTNATSLVIGSAAITSATLTTDNDAANDLAITGGVTITGQDGSASFTLGTGDAAVSDGSLSITDADNAVSLSVVNNTANTIGAGVAGGINVLSSTSLTTGDLLELQLTEGTLNGGYYLNAWDVTGSASVFSIGEDGTTTIAGVADGTDALILTAGDILVTDGDIDISDGTFTNVGNVDVVIDADAATPIDIGADVFETGNIVDITFDTAETQNGGNITGINLDFTSLTTSGSDNFYGIHLNDQVGATATTEYGIYVEGVNWDYGLYSADDVYIATDLTVAGGDITGANSEAIDIGEAEDGSITLSESGGQTLTFDLDAAAPLITTSTDTIAIQSALDFDDPSATAFTIGDGTNNYFTFDGSTDAGDTIFSWTSASSGVTSGSLASFLADTVDSGVGMTLSVDALTTGTGLLIDNAANTLTTGTLFQVQSTATSLTTAGDAFLAYYNWNPGSATTATGDLIRINIGSSGNVTNLLNITDNSSTVFRVAETQIESAVPHAFTAAGDVSIAYDLVFTNQTASTVDSYGPLTVRAGESHESNNLTLKTYNSGNIVFDIPSTGAAIFQGAVSLDSQAAFTDQDATPSVAAGSHFITANSGGATTITDFDDGTDGQIIVVEINDANTTIDCDGANINCGSTDISTADGDILTLALNSTVWNLISFMDDSDDQNDIAEFFNSVDDLQAGDVVAIDPVNPVQIVKTQKAYDSSVIGIISTDPGITLGKNNGFDSYPVALAGRVPVKISPDSVQIKKGDSITSSSSQGMAMKAVEAGPTIGKALEDWSADSGKDRITVFVNTSWYDPGLALEDLSGLKLVAEDSSPATSYQLLSNDSGQFIDQVGAFTELIVANIKIGFAEVTSLVVPNIATSEISPIEGEDLVINLDSSSEGPSTGSGQTPSESGFGKLLIKGQEGETVASIDSEGNAKFSGEIKAESVISDHVNTRGVNVAGKLQVTSDASIAGELRVGKVYADEIITRNAQPATELTLEQIEALLAEAEADQTLLDQAAQWEIDSATTSAAINELALKNLFVTGSAAFNSISVTDSIVIGTDLVLYSSPATSYQLPATNIDSTESILSLQSSASQPLYLMAGMVSIDTEGNVQIENNLAVGGNLKVEGDIETSGLTLTPGVNSLDTPGVESGFAKLLAIYNEKGAEVAGITATGAAKFVSVETDKLTITSDPEATSSATFSGLTYNTSASAGVAKIPAGASQATVNNPNITGQSLIFVTPTSETQNTLFIKEQTNGKFIAGFSSPAQEEVQFNWWLVGLVSEVTNQP